MAKDYISKLCTNHLGDPPPPHMRRLRGKLEWAVRPNAGLAPFIAWGH